MFDDKPNRTVFPPSAWKCIPFLWVCKDLDVAFQFYLAGASWHSANLIFFFQCLCTFGFAFWQRPLFSYYFLLCLVFPKTTLNSKGIVYLNWFYVSKVALNLYVNVGWFDIFVLLSHSIQYQDVSSHMLQSSAMSLSYPHINIAYFLLSLFLFF